MIAKVIRVRCKKCSAQQRFFFKDEPESAGNGDPQLVNALDPNITTPQFLLRQGNFVHVTGHRCSANGAAIVFDRLVDSRICPVCCRPNKVGAKKCGYRDCEAIFIRPAVFSGTKRSTVSVRKNML